MDTVCRKEFVGDTFESDATEGHHSIVHLSVGDGG